MKLHQTLLSSLILLSSLNAFAHDHSDLDNRRRNEDDLNRILKNRIVNFRPNRNLIKNKKLLPVTKIACDDVITQSITIANDLSCPSATGFAIKVVGDGITINGNGHKITAPNAAAGLYVEGDNNIIANLNIQGIKEGYGMMAYNASGVKVLNNNFSNNKIGIMVYADNGEINYPLIWANNASNNSFAGVRMYSDDQGSINNPLIKLNTFKSTGEYAIYVKAENYEISGFDLNNLSGSNNGYYLKSGDFKVSNLSFAGQVIYKRHFFVDSAESVSFTNVDVSSIAPATSSQERQGIDLYKVAKFKLKNVIAKNNDVGLKLETEGGISPSGTITDCQFLTQKVAGVYVVSYDSTAYGLILFRDTIFTPKVLNRIIVAAGTVAQIEELFTIDKNPPRNPKFPKKDCDDDCDWFDRDC